MRYNGLCESYGSPFTLQGRRPSGVGRGGLKPPRIPWEESDEGKAPSPPTPAPATSSQPPEHPGWVGGGGWGARVASWPCLGVVGSPAVLHCEKAGEEDNNSCNYDKKGVEFLFDAIYLYLLDAYQATDRE